MSPKNTAADQPQSACSDQSLLSTERNRYFTGKYMTARDFRDEQNYLLSHHRWHQWTLHGWGIVWGLRVSLQKSASHEVCVRIDPGMALDCHGRELVLSHPVIFPVEKLLPEGEGNADASGHALDQLVGLRFDTIDRDPVPVLLDDECRAGKNAHNRILEFAKVCWQPHCEKCWTPPRSDLPVTLPQAVATNPSDECCGAWTLEQHNHPDECCDHRGCAQEPIAFRPECSCETSGFVPLARVQKGSCSSDKTPSQASWTIDDLGCRYVHSPYYGEALTHIVGINWHHAQGTKLEDVVKQYESVSTQAMESVGYRDQHDAKTYLSGCHDKLGRLAIEFDRPLSEATSADLSQLLNLEYVLLDRSGDPNSTDLDGDDPPKAIITRLVHQSQCRRWLYCDFPVHGITRHIPVRLRITLNCDLILDDRGRAVDGDHIGGYVQQTHPGCTNHDQPRPRTGNGVEGGVFYSWTTLTE